MKRMIKAVLRSPTAWMTLVALALPLAFQAPAAAQRATLPEIAKVVRSDMVSILHNPTAVDIFLRSQFRFPLDSERLAIYQRHAERILLSDQFHLYVAGAMEPVYRSTMPAGERSVFTRAAFVALPVRGMARLTATQQAEYVRTTALFMRALKPEQCAAALRGTLTKAALDQGQRQWFVTLPVAEFRAIFDLYTAAALAELAQSPALPGLSAEQRAKAQEVYRDTATKRVPVIKSVMAQLAAGGPAPKDTCRVLADGTDAMRYMPEPHRTWQLIAHTQQAAPDR